MTADAKIVLIQCGMYFKMKADLSSKFLIFFTTNQIKRAMMNGIIIDCPIIKVAMISTITISVDEIDWIFILLKYEISSREQENDNLF